MLLGTFLVLASVEVAEIASRAGFDWAAIDLEHGVGDERTAAAQVLALRSLGCGVLVRIEENSRPRFQRALDAGADGVIVPQVRNAEEAAIAVSNCRYSGSRGVAYLNRAHGWTAAVTPHSQVDASVVCAVQIENTEALADVEAIAAVDGVDCLFVGPADLGNALGAVDGPGGATLLSAAEVVVAAARRYGKAAGVVTGEVTDVANYARRGFTLLGIGGDAMMLLTEMRRQRSELSEAVA
jgi:2-keto-3-deoxy-L-rhamnonate aldolase RhmA